MKKCPYCAEAIQEAAIKCRFCASVIAAPQSDARPSQPAKSIAPQKWGRGWIIGILALVIMGVIISEGRHPIGPMALNGGAASSERRTTRADYGCQDVTYFKTLIGYAVANDVDLFKLALNAGVVLGQCTYFKADEPIVIVERGGFFSGLVKLRRRGETPEFWTHIEAIEPPA